jgi:GH15 family glucan-1,4-alpha-glucosidase
VSHTREEYPPIASYGLIGDCHTAALVGRDGSIDWCCMPRFDSGSIFGRLLDWERGGCCAIEPDGVVRSVQREYLKDTLVLVTTFHLEGGVLRITDCMEMRVNADAVDPHRRILRVLEAERGSVDVRVRITPRFDYGDLKPWIRHEGRQVYSAVGGDEALVLSGDLDLTEGDDHEVYAEATIRPGERTRLSLSFTRPEELDKDPPGAADAHELDRLLDGTVKWWRDWAKGIRVEGPQAEDALRSASVLMALSHAPTGAIVAAPTTSLPEAVGSERNFDYRFSWIRDASLTVRAMADLGFDAEADRFRRFMLRTAGGSIEDLQVCYGVGGERRIDEDQLDLEGYRGSRPVRVGNAASRQLQLDVYGELLNLTWRWHKRGNSPSDDDWRFIRDLVDAAVERWQEPDAGIWEWPGKPKHFVHSKALCWAAIDRGLRLAEECMRKAPERRWRKARNEIREAVEAEGYDERRGVFVQAFGEKALDASLLLLPTVEFVSYDDERMIRTADAIREELDDHGLIRRYNVDDGLKGREGAFVACSFWLAECYANQHRFDDAREVFDRTVACANELGLYSEEWDTRSEQMVGNFPQGLTHLSHIAAVVALYENEPKGE